MSDARKTSTPLPMTTRVQPAAAGSQLPAPFADEEEELIDGGKMMPLWDHLTELRQRLVRSMLALLVLFLGFLAIADKLVIFLRGPLESALPAGTGGLHFTGPMDVFMVNLKVAMLASSVLGCPVWLYQFWKFFEPALYPRERRYILPFIVMSVVMFFLGISFCYFFILPLALEYLIGLGMEIGTPLITIKDYIGLLLTMLFGFGLVFEAPLLIVLMALLDLVSVASLKAYRRFVIVAIFIIAAVITPTPDPISMIAMAMPMYVMYELAILVVSLIKRQKVSLV